MQYCPPLAAVSLRKRPGEPAHPLGRGSFLGFLMSANEISLSEEKRAASGGGVFPSLGGRTTAGGRGHRSHPPPLASPPSSPLTDPPQSPHSSFRSVRPPARVESAADPSVRPSSPAAAAIAAPDNFSLSPSLVKSGRTDGPLVTSPTHPSATQGPSLSEFCVLC